MSLADRQAQMVRLSVDSPKCTEFGRASAGGKLGIGAGLRSADDLRANSVQRTDFALSYQEIDLSVVRAVAKRLLEVSGGFLNRYTG
jgi:hypothetical protein